MVWTATSGDEAIERCQRYGEQASAQWGGLCFTCLEVRERRIQRVRCTRVESPETENEEKER